MFLEFQTCLYKLFIPFWLGLKTSKCVVVVVVVVLNKYDVQITKHFVLNDDKQPLPYILLNSQTVISDATITMCFRNMCIQILSVSRI